MNINLVTMTKKIVLTVMVLLIAIPMISAFQIPTIVEVPEKIPFDNLKVNGIGLWGVDKEGAWSNTVDIDPKEKIHLVFYSDGTSNLTLFQIQSGFNQPVERRISSLGVQPAGFNDLEIGLGQTDFAGVIYYTLMEIDLTKHKLASSPTVTCFTGDFVIK